MRKYAGTTLQMCTFVGAQVCSFVGVQIIKLTPVGRLQAIESDRVQGVSHHPEKQSRYSKDLCTRDVCPGLSCACP